MVPPASQRANPINTYQGIHSSSLLMGGKAARGSPSQLLDPSFAAASALAMASCIGTLPLNGRRDARDGMMPPAEPIVLLPKSTQIQKKINPKKIKKRIDFGMDSFDNLGESLVPKPRQLGHQRRHFGPQDPPAWPPRGFKKLVR